MSTKRKLTRWIDGQIDPIRPGVYERNLYHEGVCDYAKWDGLKWWCGCGTISLASKKRTLTVYGKDEFKWRGLASDPAQEKKNGKR